MNKGKISINRINDLRKLNIEYRINKFDNKEEMIKNLMFIRKKIDNIKSEDTNNNLLLDNDDKLMLEIQYIMQINYSILRFHQKNNSFQDSEEKYYYEFITNSNIIKNSILSIKSNIPNENEIIKNNLVLVRKLIYENLLSIYICFKFLNNYKKDFENEKKLFMDIFACLLKYESENKNNDNYLINEQIIIMILLNINNKFDDIKILIPYLNEGIF